MKESPVVVTTINISLACPAGQLDRIEQQLALVAKQQETILMTNVEAVAAIGKIEVTLGKISLEQTKVLAEVRAALESARNVDPSVATGLARLQTLADAIDEIVPDDVTPTDPPPVITEPAPAEPAPSNGQ